MPYIKPIEAMKESTGREQKAELLEKLHEQNRQISRLYKVWAKHGYSR